MAVRTINFYGAYTAPFRPFILTVDSGADARYTIPTTGGGYNYSVNTSDGQFFNGVTGNQLIIFPLANTLYDIEIRGLFPRIFVNYNAERLKVRDVKQWGDVVWGANQVGSYYGARDMTCTALDTPNTANVTNIASMYYNCLLFDADINHYDYSNVVTADYFIYGCGSFNQEIDIKLPNVVSARQSLNGTTSLIKPVKIEFDKFVIVFEIISESATKDIELIFNSGCGNFGNNCFRNTNPDRLILDGATGSFNITHFGVNFDSVAIDNLFTSLGTANTGATITLTTAQNTSGITTSIATLKGWTIVIV